MPKALPKITLEYSVADERYHVATIRGNRPTVDYSTGGQSRTARVGAWLSEDEVGLLGLAADLTIKRYTV